MIGEGVVSEASLEVLGNAIESRTDGASAPPVRRSFARMRTEDPALEDAPVVSEKPTRRFPRPRTGG